MLLPNHEGKTPKNVTYTSNSLTKWVIEKGS